MKREPDIGEILDSRYRVTGHLGSGGMGRVYRAEHLTIHRQVALKLLHPELAGDPQFAARFQREAFTGGRMRHPNCVNVSDFGQLGDGSLYLVMELCDGRLLGDVLDDAGRLPPRRALAIVRQVLLALDHAHAEGVVHRDIKPDNVILVEEDGNPDFAKLLDFGIAKLVGDRPSAVDNNLTSEGTAIGTPNFIAPEQAFGEPVDGRADLYSLTAMLFAMITGRPPYQADTPSEILRKLLADEVPRLSQVAPELAANRGLENLTLRGLAKKKEDRFSSAMEYIAALDAVVRDLDRPSTELPLSFPTPTPTPTATPTATPTPTPTARRGNTVWWLAGGVATSLVVLVALMANNASPAPLPRHTVAAMTGASSAARSAADQIALGEINEAIIYLEGLGDKILTDAPAQLQLGHAYCAAGRSNDCIAAYRRSTRLVPALAGDATLAANLTAASASKEPERAIPALEYAAGELKLDGVRGIVIAAATEADNLKLRTTARDIAARRGLTEDVDLVKSYVLDLKQLKGCEERKRVVALLAELGDKRAIEPLRQALSRKTGGFLGLGAKNANRCLREEAQAAIDKLQAR